MSAMQSKVFILYCHSGGYPFKYFAVSSIICRISAFKTVNKFVVAYWLIILTFNTIQYNTIQYKVYIP